METKVCALDIGGTNTRVAIINSAYEIEKVVIRPTAIGNVDLFLDNVVRTIREADPDLTEIKCFAMGVPGRVRHDGYIYALPNVHIEDVPLAERLEREFGKKAYVINDAEAAALAEANLGPYRFEKSLYFVTISTGVGGAFTENGKLKSSSYEVGHTMMEYKGEIHEFEHMASGTGIVHLADQNGLSVGNAGEFFSLVRNGHEEAKRVFDDWLNLLKDWFTMIDEAFSPAVYALTGGVMKSADLFFDELRAKLPHFKIERCGAGQEAGLLGAAVYGFQK